MAKPMPWDGVLPPHAKEADVVGLPDSSWNTSPYSREYSEISRRDQFIEANSIWRLASHVRPARRAVRDRSESRGSPTSGSGLVDKHTRWGSPEPSRVEERQPRLINRREDEVDSRVDSPRMPQFNQNSPAPDAVTSSRHHRSISQTQEILRRSHDWTRCLKSEPIEEETEHQGLFSVVAQVAGSIVETSDVESEAHETNAGLDPVGDSNSAQRELEEFLDRLGVPVEPTAERKLSPGQFQWSPAPSTNARSTTPRLERSLQLQATRQRRRAPSRGYTDEDFQESAMMWERGNLSMSERRRFEEEPDLQLRNEWNREDTWSDYLERREGTDRMLQPDQPGQYPRCESAKRMRREEDSRWDTEIDFKIRDDRSQRRSPLRRSPVDGRQVEPRTRSISRGRRDAREGGSMLHMEGSKRRRRNAARQLQPVDHHADGKNPDRSSSPALDHHNVNRDPSGASIDPYQEEIQLLAAQRARKARVDEPPDISLPTQSDSTPRESHRMRGARRSLAKRRGTMFQWLIPLPHDKDDPPPHTCFRCWKRGHRSAFCPRPAPHKHCANCGRRGVMVAECPRCSTAYQLWPGRSKATSSERNASRTRRSEEGLKSAVACDIPDEEQELIAEMLVRNELDAVPQSRPDERLYRRPVEPVITPPRVRSQESLQSERRTETLLPPFPVMSEPVESSASILEIQHQRYDDMPTPVARTWTQSRARTPTPPCEVSTRPALRIPDLAPRLAAMTPSDHQRFRRLFEVAVTMPENIQEQMYAAFFEELGRPRQ